jgi:hypothetical protein
MQRDHRELLRLIWQASAWTAAVREPLHPQSEQLIFLIMLLSSYWLSQR